MIIPEQHLQQIYFWTLDRILHGISIIKVSIQLIIFPTSNNEVFLQDF